MDKMKKKILVLCTANSCRSQMAHGYLNYFAKNELDVYSAGVKKDTINTRAIAVMKEDGIDISQHTSNSVEEYATEEFDFVLTVCESALNECPHFPARIKNIHHDFPDPTVAKGS